MRPSTPKTITVQYVAMLKEQADQSTEVLETEVSTGLELYQYLQDKYQFTIPMSQIRVAINHQFCAMSQPLHDRDLVIFIPPVCGG